MTSQGLTPVQRTEALAAFAEVHELLAKLCEFFGEEGDMTAEDSRSPVEELKAAWDDLAYLHQVGALDGVAEIIRERRRQIERLSYTPEHDDRFPGSLVAIAEGRLSDVLLTRRDGTADIGSDEDHLRKAGALAAAEIDRIIRAFSVQETAEILADPETMDAVREGESDLR
jgi:hypothetical protein